MQGSPCLLMPPSLAFAGRHGYHLQLKAGKLRSTASVPDPRADSQGLSDFISSLCVLGWKSTPEGPNWELPDPMRKDGPVSGPGWQGATLAVLRSLVPKRNPRRLFLLSRARV